MQLHKKKEKRSESQVHSIILSECLTATVLKSWGGFNQMRPVLLLEPTVLMCVTFTGFRVQSKKMYPQWLKLIMFKLTEWLQASQIKWPLSVHGTQHIYHYIYVASHKSNADNDTDTAIFGGCKFPRKFEYEKAL